MKIVLLILSISFLLSPALFAKVDYSKPSSKLRRFAKDVIFRVEKGERERYAKKWKERPNLIIHSESDDDGLVSFVRESFEDICNAAGLVEGDSSKEFHVYIGELKDLRKIAKDYKTEAQLSGSLYWKWWDGDRYISRAVVFISTDIIRGDEAKDILLENILGAFGLPDRTGAIKDTCLSKKDKIRLNITEADKALLRFYYKHVPAGTKPVKIDSLVEKYWGR